MLIVSDLGRDCGQYTRCRIHETAVHETVSTCIMSGEGTVFSLVSSVHRFGLDPLAAAVSI